MAYLSEVDRRLVRGQQQDVNEFLMSYFHGWRLNYA
jgi:hypothetical protein